MIKAEIRKHMEDAFFFEFGDEIGEATDLFKAGILDSHGYLQLLQYVQSTYQIKLTREELLSGVISSLSGIVEAVETKLNEKN